MGHGGCKMKQEKKISKSFRLSPLVVELIAALQEDRAKGPGKTSMPSETQIVEECVYRIAAMNPEFKAKIISALMQDPRFVAISHLLSKVGWNINA